MKNILHSKLVIGLAVIVAVAVIGGAAVLGYRHSKHSSPAQSAVVKGTPPVAPTPTAPAADPAITAAKAFVASVQAGSKVQVDASITASFQAEIKKVTNSQSYYDTCKGTCATKQLDLTKATATTQPYTSQNGTKGTAVTFKSPASKGFSLVTLNLIQSGSTYMVDGESDGVSNS